MLIRLPAVVTAALCSLALAGCFSDSMFSANEKASKQLSSEMVAAIEKKGMTKESPILVRIFKEESELEVWKQTTEGKYDLLKTYPICRWSGDLGPKVKQGDRQAPEGFYMITPGLMNPNSSYYLSFNTGFPNAFDRSLNRTGSNLMVHGDCSSAGCYAMTDEQIGEIFSLARESFAGGQRAFQVQAYPFRMTPKNMARHRNNPNIAFWRMLKEGNDHFEVTRQEPKVDVCDRRYVFNAIPFDPMQPFSAQQKCPVFDQPIEVSQAVKDKREADNREFAELVKRGAPTAPLNQYKDGGMNPVFAAKFPERNPNGPQLALTEADKREGDGVRSAADTPTGTAVIPAMASANDEGSRSDKIGSWLNRNPDQKTAAPAPQQAAQPAPAPRIASAPAPKPKQATQTAAAKPQPEKKPAPQKEAQQQPATLPGSTPILSAGGFSSFH
jgi:murein L,D-transpeptidase YafK